MLKHKYIFQITAGVSLLAIIVYFLNVYGTNGVASTIRSHLLIGVLVYFLFMIISVVVVALPGIPLWPLALIAYGTIPSIIITILAVNIGATINFLIGRKLGKSYVKKIVGKKHFSKLSFLLMIDKPIIFFLLRVFGNNAFDIVSYMGGLSNIPFKWYFSITLFVSSFWIATTFIILNYAISLNSFSVYSLAIVVYLIAVLSGTFLWNKLRKKIA